MWLWGAAAGAAGTAVIRGLMMASQRFAPETLPPMKEDPGHYMAKKVKNASAARYPARRTVLGAVAWAAGSLGWLPAIKLMPHVWRQRPKQVVPNPSISYLVRLQSLRLYLNGLKRSFAKS
jgi:hypothetical protein